MVVANFSVMHCLEKVVSIDVFKVVHLPAAQQRTCNSNIHTDLFRVIILISEQFSENCIRSRGYH